MARKKLGKWQKYVKDHAGNGYSMSELADMAREDGVLKANPWKRKTKKRRAVKRKNTLKKRRTRRKNPTAAQKAARMDAADAMHLYQTGQAHSLKAAWRMIR